MKRVLWTFALVMVLAACEAPAGKNGGAEDAPPTLAASQYTLQQVLERHVEALGGADNLAAVQSVLKRGTITTPDLTGAPLITAIRNRAAYLRSIERPGSNTVLAWDGQTAWQQGAMVGSSEATTLDAKQALLYSVLADVSGPLVDSAAKGYEVQLLGTDPEGLEVVQVMVPVLGKRLYYLDPKTFLISRVEEFRDPPAAGEPEMKVVTRYARFNAVAGVQFPYFEATRIAALGFEQSITWDTIEVNTELDDSMFAMP